jgi:hypothetical protein
MNELKLCQNCNEPLAEARVEYLKASSSVIFPNMRLPREWAHRKAWVKVCQSCNWNYLTFDGNYSMPLCLQSGEVIESAPLYPRWQLDQLTAENT